MKKRGTTHVDWTISLAFFLMYIIWFFFFVRPNFFPDETQLSLIRHIETNFKSDYTWTINKLPLMIRTNVSNSHEPIIADFPYPWSPEKTFVPGIGEFILDNGKIIFLGNVKTGTNLFWMLNSMENYTSYSYLKTLNANQDSAASGLLKVVFNNNIYTEIYYNDAIRVNQTSIRINNEALDIRNNYTDIRDSLAIYRTETIAANHTSYVFAENSFLYNYFNLNRLGNYYASIVMSLHRYTDYFSSNLYYGNINYSNPGCTQFYGDRITFYDANGVTFLFSNITSIRFCYDNNIINLNISFPLKSETFYKLFFHEGNFTSIEPNRYEYYFGSVERQKGLYLEKIKNIDYEDLRRRWKIPMTKEFKITVWNTTYIDLTKRANYTLAEIGFLRGTTKDVTASEWNDFIVSKYGKLEEAVVNIKTW